MDAEFVTLTPENLAQETLCCIVRTRTKHPGVEAKRAWLAERLPEGHVFCKLRGNGCAFVEYAPLETAWVPVAGSNFLYIYCLWVLGDYKGKGYGRALMERALTELQQMGMQRVTLWVLSTNRQAIAFYERCGFTTDGAVKEQVIGSPVTELRMGRTLSPR